MKGFVDKIWILINYQALYKYYYYDEEERSVIVKCELNGFLSTYIPFIYLFLLSPAKQKEWIFITCLVLVSE